MYFLQIWISPTHVGRGGTPDLDLKPLEGHTKRREEVHTFRRDPPCETGGAFGMVARSSAIAKN
ncbi:hypothetical protein MAR_008363 [Mya arenaria]|uniref:Uncharacterized protein n=1 Tax=Mya arenaria TaxID=6604 RepID=A0ABY7DVQ7_MYAAR|nr:hypothetical protein MAR_008363 [Mya arenaria]